MSSDHLPVTGYINAKYHPIENEIFCYNKANWSKFAQYISRNLPTPPNFTEVVNKDQIEEMILSFNNAIKTAINWSVPKIKQKPKNKVLPNNIKILIQFRNIYRRNWKRFRDLSDHQEMTRLNKCIKEEIFKYRNSSWNNMLSQLDKSSSPFWNLSKILRKKHRNIPILKDNNVSFCTLEDKCNLLANTFEMNNNVSNHLSDNTTIADVNNVGNRIKQIEAPHIDDSYLISIDKRSCLIEALKNKISWHI